jgi:poly(A) polymerase/tRNA nucleotidyltransferase (CCA-adding enzyme)
MSSRVPKEVTHIAAALAKHGYRAYLVGGCVRDTVLGRAPKDWDIATDAEPHQIQEIFLDSVYENDFGTVGVKTDAEDPAFSVIEVTTFRREAGYSDKRHPDEVSFAKTIEEDLSRRDFTVNAIAMPLPATGDTLALVDPFGGKSDIDTKLIRAVRDPQERFREDALRLLRAIRLSAELGFAIEEETRKAITQEAGLIEFVSKERIRDEVSKLLMAEGALAGFMALHESGILKYIFPELEEGVGVGQNKHHIYTVFEHNIKSFAYAVEKKFPLHLRIASLLHDVGKPRVKKGDGADSTFYGHQVVGERMAVKMLDRLHFPRAFTERVGLLVREHMFVYDPDVVTEAGVRRLIRRVGPENTDDLLKLREADRIGSGVPKAQPYRLRYLGAMIEKVQKDPIHPKMLKLKGDAVMEILKIPAGPRVGKILAVLLEEVLDDPALNKDSALKKRVRELGALPDAELDAFAKRAKEKAQEAQERIDGEIKKKYFVK